MRNILKRWIAMYRIWKKMDNIKWYIEAAEDKIYTECVRCTRRHETYEGFTAEFMPIRTHIQMLIDKKRIEFKQLKLDYEALKQPHSKEPKKN